MEQLKAEEMLQGGCVRMSNRNDPVGPVSRPAHTNRECQGAAQGLYTLFDPGEAQTEGGVGSHPLAVILDLDLGDLT
jgi:hypothetical protein